jgi:multidrug efflux pump subunit AcrA (membrane-fusion protein)
MKGSITATLSASQRELEKKRKELNRLETQLAQRMLDLATIQAELKALNARYMRKVGIRQAQLDILDSRIADQLARLNPESEVAKKQAEKARRKAERASREAGAAQAIPEERTRFKPSENLRSLYRDAAKRIHPDLACDEADQENRTRWMVEINAAYQAGDEERLRDLLEQWENSPESVQGNDYNADLERIIRKIAQVHVRLKGIDAEFEKIRNGFLYTLRLRIEKAQMEGRDLLEEMAQKVEKMISRKQSLLDDLLKNAPPEV